MSMTVNIIKSLKKCSRCKKQFEFIDANNHCIDCWEHLQWNPHDYGIANIVYSLRDFILSVAKHIKVLKSRQHKAQCTCEKCRGWIYR